MKRILSILLASTIIFGTVTTVNAMTWREWIKSEQKIEFAKNVKTCISIGWTEVEDAEMYHLQVSKEPYFKTHADWHLNGNVNYIGADRVGSGGYITGLKNKPKYYVRIRAKVNGKYRRWSTVKKVKEVDVNVDTDQNYGEIVDNFDLYR